MRILIAGASGAIGRALVVAWERISMKYSPWPNRAIPQPYWRKSAPSQSSLTHWMPLRWRPPSDAETPASDPSARGLPGAPLGK